MTDSTTPVETITPAELEEGATLLFQDIRSNPRLEDALVIFVTAIVGIAGISVLIFAMLGNHTANTWVGQALAGLAGLVLWFSHAIPPSTQATTIPVKKSSVSVTTTTPGSPPVTATATTIAPMNIIDELAATLGPQLEQVLLTKVLSTLATNTQNAHTPVIDTPKPAATPVDTEPVTAPVETAPAMSTQVPFTSNESNT